MPRQVYYAQHDEAASVLLRRAAASGSSLSLTLRAEISNRDGNLRSWLNGMETDLEFYNQFTNLQFNFYELSESVVISVGGINMKIDVIDFQSRLFYQQCFDMLLGIQGNLRNDLVRMGREVDVR